MSQQKVYPIDGAACPVCGELVFKLMKVRAAAARIAFRNPRFVTAIEGLLTVRHCGWKPYINRPKLA
jgi:hypothetical protein